MEFIKQYIVQSISAASNSLRLNNQKIEVVALLREIILKSDNLENDIKEMKKITEVSTLAIRLHEIFTFLTQSTIDFFKISEKFKDHSRYLIKDLSHLLDVATPHSISGMMEKLRKDKIAEPPLDSADVVIEKPAGEIPVDLSRRTDSYPVFNSTFDKEDFIKEKEDIIFEDNSNSSENDITDNFEDIILKPIKAFEPLLKLLIVNDLSISVIQDYIAIFKKNAQLSETANFDVIANMHRIAAKALNLIVSNKLSVDKETVECIRACLIVIVAIVKGKNVDITNYLNKAKDFGQKILTV